MLGSRIALFCLLLSLPLAAQDPSRREARSKTEQKLRQIVEEVEGAMGLATIDLVSGETFSLHGQWAFPQGSAIKVPILIELFRQAKAGRLSLEEPVVIRKADQVGGSGILKELGDGSSRLSLADLAVLMIVLSDNSATNILIGRLGMERVNRMLEESGFKRTRLERLMMDTEARARGRENLSTPLEAARIMEGLYRGRFLDAETSRRILAILEKPKPGAVRSGVPAGVKVAFKPGSIPGVRAEWALVELEARPYVLVLMGNYGRGEVFERAFREVSRLLYREYWRRAHASPWGTYVEPGLMR